MAYSQTQLEALEAALASGMLRLSFEGRSVEYRSVEELRKAIAVVKAALAAADNGRADTLGLTFDSGPHKTTSNGQRVAELATQNETP